MGATDRRQGLNAVAGFGVKEVTGRVRLAGCLNGGRGRNRQQPERGEVAMLVTATDRSMPKVPMTPLEPDLDGD
jgi:hypothetical protein